jgi:hypothetical protein
VLSQKVNRVPVYYEVEVFRDFFGLIARSFFDLDQHIVNGKCSRNPISFTLYPVREDNLLDGVEKEENVVPDATNFDVSLVAAKGARKLIREMVDKGLDARGNGVAVVGDSLMRDLDAVHVVHQGSGLAERDGVVDVIGQYQAQHMGRSGDPG